jgi:hypothetical protein
LFSIFSVFMKILNQVLPKFKVAHFIRQSCLYTTSERNKMYINTEVLSSYPLISYYIKYLYTAIEIDYITSFYYNKNNLIAYYIRSLRDSKRCVIPLYNYAKNDYELVLLDYSCSFSDLHMICGVKAPNLRVYLLMKGDNPISIVNASNGTLLYNFYRDSSKDENYLFHSMPIVNSFVLVATRTSEEIIFHVVDLIKEEIYVQNYSFKKIIETLSALLNKNVIRNLGKLSFEVTVSNRINNSIVGLVFYDRCTFNISLSFENDKADGKKTNISGKIVLEDVLSVVAAYQNNELTVTLQINSNTEVKTPSREYEVDFGSNTVLLSNKYKIDEKYNISQSYLYSVIAYGDDYAIISEHNIYKFVLYYKNRTYISFLRKNFIINNLDGILSTALSTIDANKRIVFLEKDILLKSNKTNKYYWEIDNSGFNIIDIDFVRNLSLNNINKKNNTNRIGIDITGKVKHVSLENKLKDIVQHLVGFNAKFGLPVYAYYVDYNAEELYLLTWVHLIEFEKLRVCLFRGKIKSLIDGIPFFRLIWVCEDSVPLRATSILRKINIDILTSNRLLRLLANKLNTGNGLINLKIGEIYEKGKAYYDYGYNRRSIGLTPEDTSITSTLHLVRRILPIF